MITTYLLCLEFMLIQLQQNSDKSTSYVDDSQIFDYDHPEEKPDPNRPQSRASQNSENGNGYGIHDNYQYNKQQGYDQYGLPVDTGGDQNEEEMW